LPPFVIPSDLSAEASAKAEAKMGLAVAGTATFYLMRQSQKYLPPLDGDITGNRSVDMADLQALILHWAQDCE
jgi:hypothetical protein